MMRNRTAKILCLVVLLMLIVLAVEVHAAPPILEKLKSGEGFQEFRLQVLMLCTFSCVVGAVVYLIGYYGYAIFDSAKALDIGKKIMLGSAFVAVIVIIIPWIFGLLGRLFGWSGPSVPVWE